MEIKLIGAFCVLFGCTGFGVLITRSIKKESNMLRQLIMALDYMMCELDYRKTPLPELFRLTSSVCSGVLCRLFLSIAVMLDEQTSADASSCISSLLKRTHDLPKTVTDCLSLLGQSIGVFNLNGQLISIEAVKSEAVRMLALSTDNQKNKVRCYKTLCVCAGVALVIIFI